MSTTTSTATTSRRFYIDHDAAREEAIVRRVLVSPTRAHDGSLPTAQPAKNAATLLGVGRLVRGRLIRRCR